MFQYQSQKRLVSGLVLIHCQGHNGSKALRTLTHSTPLVQSRSSNKLWNLDQILVYFFWQRAKNTYNFDKSMLQHRDIPFGENSQADKNLNLMSYLKKVSVLVSINLVSKNVSVSKTLVSKNLSLGL